MNYVVKTRELKWAGKTLFRGDSVDPQSDRDHKHIDLLVKIGKVEAGPEKAPARHAATIASPPRAIPIEPPEADELASDAEEEEPLDADRNGYIRKDEIAAELTRRGVAFDPGASRATLVALLKGDA